MGPVGFGCGLSSSFGSLLYFGLRLSFSRSLRLVVQIFAFLNKYQMNGYFFLFAIREFMNLSPLLSLELAVHFFPRLGMPECPMISTCTTAHHLSLSTLLLASSQPHTTENNVNKQ